MEVDKKSVAIIILIITNMVFIFFNPLEILLNSVPIEHKRIADNFELVDANSTISTPLVPVLVDSSVSAQLSLFAVTNTTITPGESYSVTTWIWYSVDEKGNRDPNGAMEIWGPLNDGSYLGAISKLMANDLTIYYDNTKRTVLVGGQFYGFIINNGTITADWVG